MNGQLTLDASLPGKEIPVFSDKRVGRHRVRSPAMTRNQTAMSWQSSCKLFITVSRTKLVHQEDSEICNMAYYIQHTEKWSYCTKRTQNTFHWQYLKPVSILTGMHWNPHYWLSWFCHSVLPAKIRAPTATATPHNTAAQSVDSACCTSLSSGTKGSMLRPEPCQLKTGSFACVCLLENMFKTINQLYTTLWTLTRATRSSKMCVV